MTEADFWLLIKRSLEQSDDPSKQDETLVHLLLALPEQEIIGFAEEFGHRMDDAYRWDLWAVAYIIGGGCSDDGFLDFRAWLIAQGEEFYRRCLRKPEVVAEKNTKDVFYEGMGGAYIRAYETKSGKSFLDVDMPSHPVEPKGTRWQESELPLLYPELSKRFRFPA